MTNLPQEYKKSNKSTHDPYEKVGKVLNASKFNKDMPKNEFKSRLLSELRGAAFREKTMKKENKPTTAWSWSRLVPIGAAVVVIALVAVATLTLLDTSREPEKKVPLVLDQTNYPEGVEGLFELKALQEDETGIEPGTSFELIAKAETTVEKIKSNLSFSPKAAYAVEKTNDSSYKIIPEETLNPGAVVGATLDVVYESGEASQNYQYSWTYQVQEKFQITETLPRNQSTYVPVDAGIEVTFSHAGFEKFEENFSITPDVSGKFEIHRKTAVFVPDQLLAEGTYYEVKVGKNVTLPATSETLEQDLVFGFETKEDYLSGVDDQSITIDQKTVESQTTEPPTIFIQPVSYDGMSEATLTIYQFTSSEDFAKAFESLQAIPHWAYRARDNWSYPTDGLTEYAELTLPITSDQSSWMESITLLEPLPQGSYMVAIQDEGGDQALLQVTDLAAYVATSETDLVVWSHNSAVGQPAPAVKVSMGSGEELGATDSDGLLSVPMSQSLLESLNKVPETLVLETDAQKMYIPLSGNSQGYGGFYEGVDRALPYWSYLYLDQPFYRQNDTVNFWGVIEPRDGQEALEKVTIQLLSDYDYNNSYDSGHSVVDEAVVDISENGAFAGSIKAGASGYLAIVVDDEVVYEQKVNLMSFTKPGYSLDIAPANIGVISGQAVTHAITAKYFDGTPVAGQELSINYESPVTTNEAGEAVVSNTYLSYNEDWANDEYIDVMPAGSEQGEISAYGRVRVFPSSQLVKLESEVDNEKANISGELYTLDLESFNNGEVPFYENPYGDPIPSYPVKAKVTRHWYTKNQTGTAYDYIQKKNVPQYEYIPHEEVIFENDLTTNDSGAFEFDFSMLEGSYYEARVTATDPDGRTTADLTYTSNWREYNYYENNYFHLQTENEGTGEAEQYKIGDDIKVSYYRDNDKLPSADSKRFLFFEAREGIKKVTASNDADYELTFGEEHLPNIIIQGVWFDGRSYWQSDSDIGMFDYGFALSFDETERELAVEVTSDKEYYGPGDEVTLDIEVKDNNDKGVASTVNVNLIDEAIYAIQDEEVDFNKTLYRNASSGIYLSYASHRYPLSFFMAEGGGGDGFRQDFRDKALFQTVETDKKGKAQITFTVPDNLTTWRITSHAIGQDHYAGSSVAALKVTRPFMVEAVLSDQYLVEDQPIVKVRTAGTGLNAGDPVAITVSSETLPLDPVSASTTGYETVEFNLPALSLGEQKLEIKAESNNQDDAIIRTFQVIPSYLSATKVEREKVTANWQPSVQTEGPVEVIFCDQHIGQYYQGLVNRFYTWGDRLDQKAARAVSARLLNEYFNENNKVEDIDVSVYQHQEEGAAMLFPYSDQDLLLSAHISASEIGDQFNKSKLADYFNSVLNDPSETTLRHAQSLYGLAALNEPVLYEIEQVLASDKITDTDRLYLALGRAVLGDYDGAHEAWDPLMEEYGQTEDQYSYLTLGETRDEQIENTMIAALIAAELQDETASQLYNYALDNRTSDTLLVLPEVNFMARKLGSLPQESVTIKYQHLGQQETREIAKGETATVVLTPDTISGFKVTEVQGQAEAVVTYRTALSPDEITLDDRLSVTRTYTPAEAADGELVTVTLTPTVAADAPDGSYQVNDFIPSGFRLASWQLSLSIHDVFGQDVYHYPYEVEGQRVSFWVSKDYAKPITYFIRSASKGTFTAEPPIVQSMNSPSVRAGGEQQTVTVE